jgi:hypothetical protein
MKVPSLSVEAAHTFLSFFPTNEASPTFINAALSFASNHLRVKAKVEEKEKKFVKKVGVIKESLHEKNGSLFSGRMLSQMNRRVVLRENEPTAEIFTAKTIPPIANETEDSDEEEDEEGSFFIYFPFF